MNIAGLTGQRVFVTGADGFIGSHVVELLVEAGADVTAMCIYNSNGSLGWLDSGESEAFGHFKSVLGDIRDPELLRSVIPGHDVVLHLAALIAIPYSYLAPRSFVETNVMGTLNVLEACRACDVGRIVNTSTSEVYGTPDEVPITESHALKGQSPYSASKIGADKLAESYALSFELPVVTLRPFNTYGPRQSARAVIPTVIGQLLAGADDLRLGSTTPQRDFTYVRDTALGFLRIATADIEPGATIQLGTGSTYSIGEVVATCQEIVGSNATISVDPERVRPAGSEVEILLSDPTKAMEQLGWKAETSLREGLEQVVEWIRDRGPSVSALEYQR